MNSLEISCKGSFWLCTGCATAARSLCPDFVEWVSRHRKQAMNGVEVTPQAILRDVTLSRNQAYGIEQVSRNWSCIHPNTRREWCAGKTEILAFTGRISDLFLFILCLPCAPHHCSLVILSVFSLTAPQWLKVPRVGWSCQLHEKVPALLTGNKSVETSGSPLWSQSQLLCGFRAVAPMLLFPFLLVHCNKALSGRV